MPQPVYFLVADRPIGFTAYSAGSNIFGIEQFHTCRIVRYYPEPYTDLTPRLSILQNSWRVRRSYCRWASHPRQQMYRKIHGRFPLRSPNPQT